ncbi:MAG: hypothetical protein PHE51_04325 [Eubacteriales bacterium]|nr:hypothetical protein [Eubacteriales bacterium]
MYDKLNDIGVDTKTALAKLGGKKEMYERFLKRFISDPNYEEMIRNYEMSHFDTMLTKAHNLSGTSAKLGMTQLSDACRAIVSLITKGETDSLSEYVEKAAEEYTKISTVLKAL